MPENEIASVLVVDDEPDVCSTFKRLIETIPNVRAFTAHSALAALQLLRMGDFDVVLTDHMMPGMTGEDLLILVKERWRGTRRLLVTGFYSPELVAEARAHEVLIKPVSADVLKRIVEREIRKARSEFT